MRPTNNDPVTFEWTLQNSFNKLWIDMGVPIYCQAEIFDREKSNSYDVFYKSILLKLHGQAPSFAPAPK